MQDYARNAQVLRHCIQHDKLAISRHTFHWYAVKAFVVLLLCCTVDLNAEEWTKLPRRIPVSRLAHANVSSTPESPTIERLTLSNMSIQSVYRNKDTGRTDITRHHHIRSLKVVERNHTHNSSPVNV